MGHEEGLWFVVEVVTQDDYVVEVFASVKFLKIISKITIIIIKIGQYTRRN